MIGAGVYTTSGYTLAALQSPTWVVTAWIVGGLIAICGAICYGALAKELTQSGGEYLFLSRKLHPIAGLMAGWVSLLAGFTGAIAFAATTLETYLNFDSQSQLGLPRGMIASGVVVIAAILHTIGVRPGARVQDVVVVLKFVLIAAFVLIAVVASGSHDRVSATPENPIEPISSTAFMIIFATQLMYISLSYSGFNAAVYVAGEVHDAERNVPRSLLLGTLLVTACYVALNAVFVFAAPIDVVKGQPDVATKAAESIGGASFATFVRVVILFGLFTSVSAMIMSGPRVYAKMAEDGFLPSWFRFTGRPPTVAIWAQAAFGIAVIWVSDLERLLKYLGFTLSVSAALTATLLFWVRGQSGERIRTVLYPIPPIIFVGGTLLVATLAAIQSPTQALVGLATIVFGALLYPFVKTSKA